MGKVVFSISVSLDGFVAGPNDEVDELFKWYFSGDVEIPLPGGMSLKVSKESAGHMQGAMGANGAMICGKRMYTVSGAWNGMPPFSPCFVVTHNPDPAWQKDGSPFTFVTDGVESAIRQAQQAAGDQNVVIATPNILQQALKLGLVDEISFDLVHVLLGQGIRLFEHTGIEPLSLQRTRVIDAPGVTHMSFRVK